MIYPLFPFASHTAIRIHSQDLLKHDLISHHLFRLSCFLNFSKFQSFIFAFLLIGEITLNWGLENFPNQTPFLPQKANTPQHSNFLIFQKNLSLQQAIYLALRHNTDLLTSLNNRQLENFDLLLAKQKFEPQFTLNNSLTYAKTADEGTPDYATTSANIGPGMTWTLPLGTQLATNLTYAPTHQTGSTGYSGDSFNYSMTVTQPLLQNFGTKINDVDLDNAYDQQIIDDLNLRKTVQTTIINTANAYYAVVAAEQSYAISKRSLEHAQQELTQRQAKLSAGQIPATDVTQAQIDLMTQQQSLESSNQALSTAKADFLNTLGLPSDTDFTVDPDVDIQSPNSDIKQATALALKNNIDLKIEALQSKQDTRNINKSQNSRLWQLNLVLSSSHSTSSTDYTDPDSDNVTQTGNSNSVSLNLSIPLNQVTLDQQELSSAISLNNQQISEAQQKRTVINNVIAAVQNLQSQWTQLQISEQKQQLSEGSAKAAQIEYQYGKIDAFSLQQQQESAIDAEQDVVNLKINYLKQYMTYEQLMGTLLDQWHVNIASSKSFNPNLNTGETAL